MKSSGEGNSLEVRNVRGNVGELTLQKAWFIALALTCQMIPETYHSDCTINGAP